MEPLCVHFNVEAADTFRIPAGKGSGALRDGSMQRSTSDGESRRLAIFAFEFDWAVSKLQASN